MNRGEIIMNFGRAPSLDDMDSMARAALPTLPDELAELCENLTIQIEDFPDDATQQDCELDDPYELLALYRSGSQISPGITKKTANDDDALILYRRPILDAWCESGEDINALIRQVMTEEIAQNFDFAEDEIEELSARAIAGML